ncbi:hypothetical protein GPL17_30300 [Bradyrhizobium yuanmingense]|uniref:hypothetical protein n=1 Tax=Bradyrhizobium yuanmingense TaxID=108015 RepID=UPI0012FBBF7D|nr:hypothetical protein [Bradyrhizobium yuanmingense]MVT54747.1 hypothetical protein [Bradyrhizobium yuanmingense]
MQADEEPESIPDAGALVSFETNKICFATGYKVARLERYYVWTNPDPAALARQYKDYATSKDTCKVIAATAPSILANGGVKTDARGYSSFHSQDDGTQLSWTEAAVHILILPLWRYYFQSCFRPVVRYGLLGSEVDFLEPDPGGRVKNMSAYVRPKVTGSCSLT